MRSARALALGIGVLAASPAGARAQVGSPDETPTSDVVQDLGLQEEVFAQDRGHLQWGLHAGVHETDEEAVLASRITLELGVADGLEVQGAVPIQVGLRSGATGLGQSTLGLLWAPLTGIVDPDEAGVALFVDNAFPARSGVGEAGFAHDASAIGHYALGRAHAQVSGGIEIQHGRELREVRQESVRVDPQASLALWVHLDTVAIALEGAAEPEPERFAWQVGPTVLWNAARDLVLMGHGNASFGGERPLYEGILAAVMQTELFR